MVLIILATLAVNVIIPGLDHNPVYVRFQNNRYVAFNKYGKDVWKSELLNTDEIPTTSNRQRIVLADLDNDGKNEILLIRLDNKNSLMNKCIFCYYPDNTLKWKTVITPKDSLYGKDICYDGVYLRNIIVIENKHTKQKEIIVDYVICDLFPYFVTKLDNNGKEISTFYNPGNTDFVNMVDINGEGREELIIGGVNNDFNKSGCLIVLDPEFIEGKAPGYRFPRGFNNGLMKYYILFPKTLLTRFSAKQCSGIHSVLKYNNRITADLYETADFVNENSEYRTIFNFDQKFNFLHLQTSLEFDARYKELIEQGKIQPIQDWIAYEDSLRKEIKFWDGDKFVNYPTINKYYLQAKAQLSAKTAKN